MFLVPDGLQQKKRLTFNLSLSQVCSVQREVRRGVNEDFQRRERPLWCVMFRSVLHTIITFTTSFSERFPQTSSSAFTTGPSAASEAESFETFHIQHTTMAAFPPIPSPSLPPPSVLSILIIS